MSQRTKRRWLCQFSLRTFLLVYLVGGGAVAWVSYHYRDYLAEQSVIEMLAKKSPSGSWMTVAIDGNTAQVVGNLLS